MNIKKICAVFICLVSMLSFAGISVCAGETYLSETSLTLEEGQTAALKLVGASGKILWRISDSSVCTYSKGTVTAKSKGSAVITAENGGKSYKCKVTVKAKTKNENAAGTGAQTGKYSDAVIPMAISEIGEITVSNLAFNGVKITNDAPKTVGVKGRISGRSLTLELTAKAEGNAYVTLIDKSDESNTVVLKIEVSQNPGNRSVVGGGTPSEDVSAEDYADKVIELVNKERKAAGLKALEKDDVLCANAETRAKELAKKFSHTRPDGTECFTAITVKFGFAGENIAQGQPTPADVMSSWMDSDGHRSNILSKDYAKIGVGFDPSSNSWVQIFTD